MPPKASKAGFKAMTAPGAGTCERDVPKSWDLTGQTRPQPHGPSDFAGKPNCKSTGPQSMPLKARAIDRGGDRPNLMLYAVEEGSGRTRKNEALPASENLDGVASQVPQRQAELAHALRISTVGELVAGFAHELNQPLSAIANGVEACARYVRSGRAESDMLLALLDDASAEALRAGRIVEHMRGFIEKGKPEFERTDLCKIARNVSSILSREIEREHITFRLDLPPRPLPIDADGIQIEQVIVNLMHNAIDAIREAPSDRQEIQLRVRAAKGKAAVAVSDTGTGVAAAATARMFEPFFTTKSHGLGMGLAISRSILEAHGGRIWVKRRADGSRGTTVCFSLPLPSPGAAGA